MTLKQFKIWLVMNDYNQTTLAKRLNISPDTIGNYVKNERFPEVFQLALKGLEL